MSSAAPAERPFHLQGNFAPVSEELTETALEVTGKIPPELCGLYARNGANPVTGESEHWFMGNGMIHGVRLDAGKALWYRNRYVQTPLLDDPEMQRVGADGSIDRTASAANTHVIEHAGKIMALEEGSFPFLLNEQLETLGHCDFGGKLKSAMTAHPKICPVTGELHFFGYGQLPPYLVYHRVSPQGELIQSEEISVGGPTMIHDFSITEKYVLFMDLPIVFDLPMALQGQMPFHWSDDYPARVGIMPRGGRDADVRWFEINPCYVFHVLNSWSEGEAASERVSLDVCHIEHMWRDAGAMEDSGPRTLRRFSFDMGTGNAKEEVLDDRQSDFPRVADARIGLKNRFGYVTRLGGTADEMGEATLLQLDLRSGSSVEHAFGAGRAPGEPVFVPAPGSDPDGNDGWVLTYLYDEAKNGSELTILDASDFSGPPVASIHLPSRVPFGFHGSWIPRS